jgi:DNA ligase-associated metallophosphoesterase
MPTEAATLALAWAGEQLLLDGERALAWPARSTVVVADVHLGKDGAFRRAGYALPAGETQVDLERLGRLVERHRARRLLVLGDFVHAPPAAADPLLAALAQWLAARPTLALEVVIGNHDRPSAGAPLSRLVQWRAEGLREGPFEWRHAAAATSDPAAHQVCGHVHPALRLRSGPHSLRLPVFALESRRLTLPAFAGFSGGATPQVEDAARFFAVVDGSVLALPEGLQQAQGRRRSAPGHRHKP